MFEQYIRPILMFQQCRTMVWHPVNTRLLVI